MTPIPLPNAIVIGAQKSATRWLRANLADHPDLFFADREIAFFSHERRYRELGIDWYRRQFEGWDGEAHIAEGTPGYMMWRHDPARVAERIDDSLPEVRLLAILRNPVDRAESAMVHHVRYTRLPPDARLLDVVQSTTVEDDWLGLIAGGWYARSLRPYAERFGSRLLVLFYDDVVDQPAEVYRSAAEHIGLSATDQPAHLDRVVFSNRSPGDPATRLDPDDRVALWEYFRDDVHALEEMTGRDLSSWDPASRGSSHVS